jgi:hypothetical protein
MFHELNTVELGSSDEWKEQMKVFAPLYFASTDYSCATDNFNFKIGEIIADFWMQYCGIPRLLRGIVKANCYRSRKIYFAATGPLKDTGNETEWDNIRSIDSRRGILMGDPLTKVCLHLLNICVRRMPQIIRNKTSIAVTGISSLN